MISMSRAFVEIVIVFGTMPWICGAQNAKSGPEFEVASVKPAQPRPPFAVASGLVHFRNDGAVFDVSNQSLASLISFAYGINYDRISGPGWMSGQEFAIVAKLPAAATKQDVPAMLQKLLADRFKLSLHREQKVEPVYELVADGKDLKLKPSAADLPEKLTGYSARPGQCLCRACTLAYFADILSGTVKFGARMAAMEQPGELAEHRIDRPVIDQTHLTGLYDIELNWVPPAGLPAPIPGTADGFPPRDPATKANSIFGALESVGLKLQSAKHTFDYVVADHVERVPSEN